MWIYFWLLGAYRSVYVSHAIALRGNKFHGFFQYHFAVHVQRFVGRVGEVKADVAHVCRPQKGIADGVYQHVGIAMAKQSHAVVDAYAAQP